MGWVVRIFSHVKAHQDDHIGYESLTRSAQLNCQMDYHAKKSIWESDLNPEAPTRRFPLEPIYVFLGGLQKLTVVMRICCRKTGAWNQR